MDAKTLSPDAAKTLASLRENHEYESEPGWGAVYLDNARHPDMRRHVWAGTLSALEAAGLYRPEVDRENRGIWGHVKLA